MTEVEPEQGVLAFTFKVSWVSLNSQLRATLLAPDRPAATPVAPLTSRRPLAQITAGTAAPVANVKEWEMVLPKMVRPRTGVPALQRRPEPPPPRDLAPRLDV